MQTLKAVGQRIPRIDSAAKVTGRAIYTNDFSLAGMLYVKVLRSPYARANILRLDVARAAAMPGVTVMTAGDIPGDNLVGALLADQPVLAAKEVRHQGEAVAIVGAESEEVAERALALIEVKYEPLVPLTDPKEALAQGATVVHDGGNVAGHSVLRKGDIEKGFAESDVIVEGTYETQWVEHAYIEPEVAVVRKEPDGRFTVWACTQYSHHEGRMVAKVLGVSQNRVRVIQMVTGGGFGGKIWSLYTCYPALIAYRTGRPAKIVYTRDESIVSTTKRHPYQIHYRTGATRFGRLKAVEAKLIGDTGPYMNVGKGVMSRSVVQCAGPYQIPHVKIDGYLAYTNNPLSGAFRGYGGPQVSLAHEIQMDRLAEKLGLSPLELRFRNCLKPGMETATGQVLKNSAGMMSVLQKIQDIVQDFQQHPSPVEPHQKRGVGIAVALHGVGSLRSPSRGTACVKLMDDGSATVICGSVDIGQGSDTILAQIAADELGISIDKITVVTNDSDVTPDSESTSGSKVTYFSGKAVQIAARDARNNLLRPVAERWRCALEHLELKNGVIYLQDHPEKSIVLSQALKDFTMQGSLGTGSFVPRTVSLDPNSGLGSPCEAYAFAGAVAEVAVDGESGQVDLLRAINIIDVGRAINPLLVEGQIEGGTCMGAGYALIEEIKAEKGIIGNPDFTDYKIPTAMDFPTLASIIVEEPEPSGPFQAKGFSEVTVTPVAPAILNAIHQATGIRLHRLPANAERVLAALQDIAPAKAKVGIAE